MITVDSRGDGSSGGVPAIKQLMPRNCRLSQVSLHLAEKRRPLRLRNQKVNQDASEQLFKAVNERRDTDL